MRAVTNALTSLLPVRKIASVIWKPSHSRHTRIPGTVHDCMDDARTPRECTYRTGLILVLIVLVLTLICSLYRLNSKGKISFITNNVEDIMVVKHINNNTLVKAMPQPAYPPCAVYRVGGGSMRFKINQSSVDLVSRGGYYRPLGCRARHKVAIIVPYREGETNLAAFLFHIHPFLIEQRLDYRIFVIEQSGHENFTKGRLFNAGFEQSLRFRRWQCVVLHDVSLLPLDKRILYTCPPYPRHMSATVIGANFRSSDSRFGGVVAILVEHYKRVNGYSNFYWENEGEDYDMFWRIRVVGLPVTRYDKQIAEYAKLPSSHKENPSNGSTFTGFRRPPYKNDGLSTLKYDVVSVKLRHLFTHIVVHTEPDNT